ncbi:hypothetical protein EV194_1274 [Natronoflexus pectinivorans]|uniref:Uncharacterized protein n=1 Tax=Natronoflexus pectinivorans TaxID=682526 RepID=A0A4R2G3G9_9BACT|nr:hypothetical protein EV194_1274 [Natronoflexus pectinivorans]
MPTSYIKYWGFGAYIDFCAPHKFLCRPIILTPEAPNISYM